MAPNMSLHSVNAVLILAADPTAESSRIFAKYYSPPHSSPAHPLPPQPYSNTKDQKGFEKGLLEKTAKQTSDVILYDNKVVVFKMESDVMLYVVGNADENEILLYNVVLALRDSLSILLKNSTDKRTIIENYDLVTLAIDEIVDDGIVLETDPVIVASRVSKAPAQDAPNMKNIDLSEQGIQNLWEFGKKQGIEFVIAHELSQTLPSLRISNIYDLSSRIFLFKCAKPGTKVQLLVDSGFRAHLTSFQRTANPTPSAFVARLRKYLKTRRITGVSQLGTDRVIEIVFSDGQYRLFLEFFAAGNIILTDAELNILALLRQVSEGNEDVDVKLGGKYVLEAKQNYHGIPPLTIPRIREALQTQINKVKEAVEIGGKKAKRNKGGDDLKKALSIGFSEYPSHLLEHVFVTVGIESDVKPVDVLQDEKLMGKVLTALEQADRILKGFGIQTDSKGYIIAKQKNAAKSNEITSDATAVPSREALLYDDFHPFRPSQFSGKPGIHIIEVAGFNNAVDEFYSSIESQKLESRLTEREQAAKTKLESARNEHEKRLGALRQVQEMHIRKAQAIEANTHRVEEATAAVNGLICQGMDWVDIGKLIENEQARGNVVAQMIKLPLKLHENTATLLLDEPGEDEESDSEGDLTDSESESDDEAVKSTTKVASTDKRLAVDIDLGISPWSNARQYYDQKKSAAVKQQKTIQASDKALKSIQMKTESDLKKGLKQEKAALRPARQQFWFEKFLWFISSDGYLVIGGKDAQQDEILYRRYLKKGDIYVHADLTGASSIIVKNNPTTPDAPIPPSTLSQAGALTVCSSTAWDSKAVMSAWWVNSDQVSKTAESGEYLKTGGFMIRGKKNFLPPAQLILGFGVMWLISEESRANHGKHRLARSEVEHDEQSEFLAEDTKDLSLEEDKDSADGANNHNVIADVEEVAQEAEKEIEDHEGDDISEDDDHDEANEASEDDDDKASTIASEAELDRSNPLQTNKRSNIGDAGDESLEDHDVDDTGTDGEDGELDNGVVDESIKPDTQQTSSPQPASSQPRKDKPKRGANTKAKRAAAKRYALQSDEERELAMSLLGSTKGADKKAAAEEARLAREAKSAADKERRRKQHERAAEIEKVRQERLAKAEQQRHGGGATVEDEPVDPELSQEQIELERKEHMLIDQLVPYPEPGDEIIAAIPVVAPWAALASNKFKVKMQPGSIKKGKVVREILGNWVNLGTRGPKVLDERGTDKEKVWTREVDCFKALRVEEVVGIVPVKGVRIVQSGGGNAKSNAKGKGPARGGKGGKRR